jgi:hypothetical protein
MKQLLLLLLFLPLFASASDEFSVEELIEKPNKILSPVISYLSENLGDDIKSCEIKKVDEAFEAKSVKISAHSRAFVVKPKSWCLCGAYYCPIWLFQVNGHSANPIWSTKGTGVLEVLDKKTNGYRQIKESGGVAAHGSESIWAWDGKKYEENYRQVWTWNNEKSCRETETFRLKHGKLEKTPDLCIPD